MSSSELNSESLERLLSLLNSLGAVLNDQEFLKHASELLLEPETFIVIERLPRLIALLERLSRPEILDLLERLVESLESAASAPPPSLSRLLASLSDPGVRRWLGALLGALSSRGVDERAKGRCATPARAGDHI